MHFVSPKDTSPPRDPAKGSRVRKRLVIGAILGMPVLFLGLSALLFERPLPKRFAEVEAGRLYRSGEVSGRQLAHVVKARKIKSVLCLLNPEAPEVAQERQTAERLGVNWYNVPLRGNGASTPGDRHRIREIIETAEAPLLVHCAAGTNRTGLAVGLYRIHEQGWSAAQVLEEMRRFGFEDEEQHEDLRQALVAEEEARKAAARKAEDAAGPADDPPDR